MVPAIFKSLIWDANPDGVDVKQHERWLIARVLNYGNIEQVYELEKTVGRKAITDFFKNGGIDVVDPKTTSLWMVLLGLKKTECKRRSSTPNKFNF